MDELFERIREACSAQTWSRGVELARAEGVRCEREDEGELVLRVSAREGMRSPAVTLYLAEVDWECECSTHEAACEHVAAAVIAARRAGRAGHSLPKLPGPGVIVYRLQRLDGGLALERWIRTGGTEVPLRSSIEAIVSGRVAGPRFAATAADLAVERAVGSSRLRKALDWAAIRRVIEPLAGCSDVRLDGVPIRVSSEPTTPHGVLADADGGFVLSVGPDPTITERFSNEAVLCGDTLRTVGPSKLSPLGRVLVKSNDTVPVPL